MKFYQIIDEVPEADRAMVALAARRILNMARDAGRPSDAARSAVTEYQSMDRDAYVAAFNAERGIAA